MRGWTWGREVCEMWRLTLNSMLTVRVILILSQLRLYCSWSVLVICSFFLEGVVCWDYCCCGLTVILLGIILWTYYDYRFESRMPERWNGAVIELMDNKIGRECSGDKRREKNARVRI